ncbi:MAG TPA: gluconate 2-dehydrogenase subunit 3 family protein [Bryobacteraceae bacterium]|nr:gluconate 2-dehydrogenase subunit 3 family protein [Bryobacteraceae bacterium]
MPDTPIARRSLLRSSLFLIPGMAEALQHAHDSAKAAPARIEYLKPADAAEIEAMAAEIIPSGDSPGAKEAGVIYFIDRALGSFDNEKRDLYRDGLLAAQTRRRAMFPESASIAALSAKERIALLESIEKTAFFAALREHTIIAFFADPQWGGNRGKVGWKLIGFEDKFAFQPPFGYYDAPENRQ